MPRIITVTTFVNGVKAPDVTPDVFYSRSEAIEDVRGTATPEYAREVIAWLESDPETYIDVDLSVKGSGVKCFDRWEWHND